MHLVDCENHKMWELGLPGFLDMCFERMANPSELVLSCVNHCICMCFFVFLMSHEHELMI